MNPKRATPRHIIIKMLKVKKRITKVAREKHIVTYKRNLIRLSEGFLMETLQTRRECHDIFKVLKERKGEKQNKTFQLRIFCLANYHSDLKKK